MIDFLISALRNIGRKKLRSILTFCGIAIGVASVIIIGAIGNGATIAVNGQLDSLGINGINISQKRENVNDTNAVMTQNDLKYCLGVKGVDSAMPLIMQEGNATLKGEQKSAMIWGVGSNARSIISLNLKYGKMLTQSQVSSHAKVCLIDDAFAKSIYKRTNITGKTISIYMGDSYETLKICGIVESSSSLLYNLVGDYVPTFVYLPYTTAADLRNSDGFDQIVIKEKANYDSDKTGSQIVKLLGQKHIGSSYQVSNMLKQKQKLSNILGIITLVISLVGAISLFVAGIGIMTVMLVSVNERMREIGIKKAIGAKKTTIMFEFLLEALIISLIGGIIGVALGVGISFIMSKASSFNFDINMNYVLISSGFAAATGIIFGVYPAYKAANLNPVDALRQE